MNNKTVPRAKLANSAVGQCFGKTALNSVRAEPVEARPSTSPGQAAVKIDSLGLFKSNTLTLLLVAGMGLLPANAPALEWTMKDLVSVVQPMQHALNGRMPLLAWSLPDVVNDSSLDGNSDTRLDTNIMSLWARGIVPTPSIAGNDSNSLVKTLNIGLALQKRNLPIHFFADPIWWYNNWTLTGKDKKGNDVYRHFPYDFWPANKTGSPQNWFTDSINYTGEQWPVFPLASPIPGYTILLDRLKAFKLAGIKKVAGMWMDYEDYPAPWDCANCSQKDGKLDSGMPVINYYSMSDKSIYAGPNYPMGTPLTTAYPHIFESGNIAGFTADWMQYTYDLRWWLLDQSARKALTEVYGSTALYGDYGGFFSSPDKPFYNAVGSRYPIVGLSINTAGTVAMPIAYADNITLKGPFPDYTKITQIGVDDNYWYLMLQSLSSCMQNAGTTGKSVAWVSSYVVDDTSGNYDYKMSPNLYKELLRHFWLRGGTKGMYLFNPWWSNDQSSSQYYYGTADYALAEIEYARSVLDEMLSFRSFLENGIPLNFDYEPKFSHAAVWSGLSYNGQSLLRAVSPNSDTTTVIPTITLPNGKSSTTFTSISAPPEGATYLLNLNNGSRQRVDTAAYTSYFNFDNNKDEFSKDGISDAGHPDAIFAHWVSGSAEIDTSTVPNRKIRKATYGLYANNNNTSNLHIGFDGTVANPYQGGYAVIPNTQTRNFNSRDFTVEFWLKNNNQASPDFATIVTKDSDWKMAWRSSGQIEVVFLDVGYYNNVWLRSEAGMVNDNNWHHIALTYFYDSASNRAKVSLYQDGVKKNWLYSAAGSSINGTEAILFGNYTRHTANNADSITLGLTDRGIEANFDEFRYSPSALDQAQFMVTGAGDLQ